MESGVIKRMNLGCAIVLSIVAVVVMLSWLVEGRSFSTGPATIPMAFNTAACFLLCAISLAAAELDARKTAALCALAATGLALLIFIQHVSGRDFGIDTSFVQPIPIGGMRPPSRMPLATSASFLLCGLGLALSILPRPRTVHVVAIAFMGSMAACMGLIAITAQASDVQAPALAHIPIWMAFHSAVSFVLLGACLVLRSLQRAVGTPFWLPAPVFVGLIAATVMVALAVGQQQETRLENAVRQEVRHAAQETEEKLRSLHGALDLMAQRWEGQGAASRAMWEADATAHLRSFPMLASIISADIEGAVLWSASARASDELETFNLRNNPEIASTLNWAIGIREPRATKVMATGGASGMRGFLYIRPLVVQGKITGALAALVDAGVLFDSLAKQAVFDRLSVVVAEDQQVIFTGPMRPGERLGGFRDQATILNLGRSWALDGRAGPALRASVHSRAPEAIGVMGVLLATLIASCIHLAVKRGEDLTRLRFSEQRLARAVSGTMDGLWDWDLIADEVYGSPRLRELLGHVGGPSRISGERFLELVHPDDRAGFSAALAEHLRDRDPFDIVVRFSHQDGRMLWLSMRGQGTWDEDGIPRRMTGFASDITDRKEAESKMLAYAAELERSNRELDEFAYVASHDLKAPLRVINNASRWLEEDLAEHMCDGDRENMELLRGRVQRMEKLLDDLLEYSRVGRATDQRSNEVVSGQAVMENIVMLLSPPPGFEVRVAASFTGIQVKRMPLQQVLLNLISNAIKHHDKQQGVIDVGVEDEGDRLRFTVRDDGPGIAPRFHEQVFKMFQTLKPRDQVEGSGMGLAFVKKSVRHVGGEVGLVSAEGAGAVFSFTWPKEQQPGIQVKAA